MASRADTVANRLAHEKSPYLLQHAYNPVQWYPWGQEAFDKAKAENKMIFLSIGYSTCHWCHVMERESFENPEIGKVMNEHYVSIKVDREERPDVDRVYMTFVQATTGGGGWPLSVWLTPDLKPVVGGTYFPPGDRYYGRPGFKTILLDIAGKWREQRSKVEGQGTAVLDALMQFANLRSESGAELPETDLVLAQCYSLLKKSYDSRMGGFSKAPKFPQPVNINFMLRYYQNKRDEASGKAALEMVKHTLIKMAQGGIHDHVSKGFHRYSTDDRWHVPHFEKMLYDQAQLSVAYAETYQITKEPLFAEIVRDILEYVSRDLSHKDGGFYSAEDADSYPTEGAKEKKEGAFCVWTYDEIYDILKDPIEGSDKSLADLFSRHYSVKKNGNVDPMQDPHDELKQKNVLIVEKGLTDTAEYFGMDLEKVESLLAKARDKLYEIRLTRPKASLDDKILTSWNGLMISGFSKCGQVLSDQTYVDRAVAAATFIRNTMYDESTKTLLRSSYTARSGEITQISQPIDGFVDDYAYLIRGLLDLYESCYDQKWLEWAEQLQETQNQLFWDHETSGYFNSSTKDPSIVLRLKEDQDGAEPSANSVSCYNLLRLADYLNSDAHREKALALFRQFAERLLQIPSAVPELVCSLLYHVNTPKQIIIVGDQQDPGTVALVKCVHSHFVPNKILIVVNPNEKGFLHGKLPILNSLELMDGKPTAYVCENYTCQLPVTKPEDLERLLEK